MIPRCSGMGELVSIESHWLEVGDFWPDYAGRAHEISNGVGPEKWPDALRELADKLPFLYPASVEHDVSYEHGGSESDRRDADNRFRRNCYRVAVDELGPWWTRIWTHRGRAEWGGACVLIEAAYVALRLSGGDAFNNEKELEA